MTDHEIPTSGSRWEPTTVGHGAVTATDVDAQAEHGAVPTGRGRRTRLSRRLRNRGAVAAAGVGLVLAGGIGGLAIGHASAGGSDSGISTGADRSGVPGGHRDDAGPGGRPGGDADSDRPGETPDRSTPDGSGSPPGDDDGGSA